MKHYKGQVFYYSRLGNEYPLAPSDPVIEDVHTNYQIKLFNNKNIRTNFMASHMFVHNGSFESETEREDMIKSLERFQGAEMAGNIMLIEADTNEQVPTLQPFTIQNNDKLWEFTESSTVNNIVQNYLIPPVMIGILQSGKLGTANEINDAQQFYNSHTASDRLIFEEEFSRLLGVQVQLRSYGSSSEAPSASELRTTVGGLTGFIEIVRAIKDGSYTVDAAVNLVADRFGVTKEQARLELTGKQF
jgi:hypothetical protein